tara:strand:- start:1715 stop:2437 length:723 start_codon:yes stop_codon:yes gene_type:complete
MSSWGFGRESTQVAAGANTVAGIKKGFQPFYQAGNEASKRNVIVTDKGWVRREHGTGSRAGRIKEEIIVAANPGVQGKDYSSNTYTGNPDISQIFVKLNANGYIGANTTGANLHVVFNAPIHHKASGNLCTIVVANTVGGNIGNTLFANTAAQGRIINANNTLVFRMPKLQGGTGNAKATYKIQAQSIRVHQGGNPLYNPDDGTTQAANLVITGAVSNNLLDGAGSRITTFQVAAKAGQT